MGVQRDGTITSTQLDDMDSALRTLTQVAIIPSSGITIGEGVNKITIGDNSEAGKRRLFEAMSREFRNILKLLGVEIIPDINDLTTDEIIKGLKK